MQNLLLDTTLDHGVLVISFNRPEKMNAWTYAVQAELCKTVEAANRDAEVDAVVLTGSGKGFCSGADISAVFGLDAEQKKQGIEGSRINEWIALVRRSKPMIAAVNGPAFGIGVTLILPMDQIIAAEGATFALAFVKMGIVPELASSSLLHLRVGFGAASRLTLTGDTVTAQEACDIGLVDRVVPAEMLMAEAKALARRMGRNPAAALVEAKQLLSDNAREPDLSKVQQREMQALARCFTTAEHKEAVAAFLEKRAPDFKSLR